MICRSCGSVVKGYVGDFERDVPDPLTPELASILAEIVNTHDLPHAIKRAGDGLAILAAHFVTKPGAEHTFSADDETEFDPEWAREMSANLEASGCCPNCAHTFECDVQDVRAGLGSCRTERNDMTHDCPANGPDSATEYDRLVIVPIREHLARRKADADVGS